MNPYRWARYPGLLPTPLPEIHWGRGPAYRTLDYYEPKTNTIYWRGGDDPYGFLHEVGHAYDRLHLNPQKRKALEPLLKAKHRRWFWGQGWEPLTHSGVGPMEEVFADAYARCQLHRVAGLRLRRALRRLGR